MASHRTLPDLSERFTIGRVLVQSWRAFAADHRWLLLIAAVVAAVAVLHAQLTGGTGPYGSRWSFLTNMWISGVIQSFAIAPITLGVLNRDGARSYLAHCLKDLPVTFEIALVVCVQLILMYWPLILMVGDPPLFWHTALAAYLVIIVNAVAFGTLTKLFYPILLVERCSLGACAMRSVRQAMPHIWRMAALCILYWIVYFGGCALLVLLVHSLGASASDWIYNALFWPLWAFLILAGNIIAAVAYRLLRQEREGPDLEHLAQVFE